MIAAALGVVALAAWVYLLTMRGGFWLADVTDADDMPAPETWPAVTAVVPARAAARTAARNC